MSKQLQDFKHSPAASAVGMIMLFNSPSVVVRICKAAIDYAKRLTLAPGECKYQKISIADRKFDSDIGKYRGGNMLMNVFGFVLPDVSKTRPGSIVHMQFRGENLVPEISGKKRASAPYKLSAGVVNGKIIAELSSTNTLQFIEVK